MHSPRFMLRIAALVCAALAMGGLPARAEMSNEDLAKLSQNPVANLISLPFQNNTNFNYGQNRLPQDILNVQPVIPFTLGPDWRLITRSVMPIMFAPSDGTVKAANGLGDLQVSGFLSPTAASNWIWGLGPITQIPTHTDPVLGNDNLGLGPTGVIVHMEKGSPWVLGLLLNNVWSVQTNWLAKTYVNGLAQPFINYNFAEGFYLTSSPMITMDWLAKANQQLVLPLGGGFGKIFHLGKQPINASISAYYNVVRPDYGADWQLRAQVQFMFPE